MKVKIDISRAEQARFVNFAIRELNKQIKKRLDSNLASLEIIIKAFLRTKFMESEAVKSMTKRGGKLKEDLGLDSNIDNILNLIIDKVLNNMVLKSENKIYAKSVKISYKLYALPVGYNDLLGINGTSYISDPSGETIPWLSWLIRRGPGVVGYYVARGKAFYRANNSNSRSGTALMFRTKSGTWKLTPGKDGVGNITDTDNFLTEVFNGIEDIIFKEINRILT